MNLVAIKQIYEAVLRGFKVEFLGGDKYRLSELYQSGQKWWEKEFKNGELVKDTGDYGTQGENK